MTWAITESDTTLDLDRTGRAQVTFTVTNTSPQRDRSVLTITPLDGAATSWYSLEDPQRVVGPGEAVDYVTDVTVPLATPPATYGLEALVYSADTDPGESSVRSNRVTFTVKPPDRRSGPPMWLVIMAIVWVALVIVGIAVALVMS